MAFSIDAVAALARLARSVGNVFRGQCCWKQMVCARSLVWSSKRNIDFLMKMDLACRRSKCWQGAGLTSMHSGKAIKEPLGLHRFFTIDHEVRRRRHVRNGMASGTVTAADAEGDRLLELLKRDHGRTWPTLRAMNTATQQYNS